jgi:hypothetical protein
LPKPKPDQIIRHEYVLGKVERQLLEQTSTAYSINRVLNPIVAALSDVSFVATMLSLYAAYLGFKWDVGTRILDFTKATTSDLIQDFTQTYEEVKGSAFSFVGNIPEYLVESLPGSNPQTYQGLQALFSFAQDNAFIPAPISPLFPIQVIGNLDLNPFDGDGLDLNPFN